MLSLFCHLSACFFHIELPQSGFGFVGHKGDIAYTVSDMCQQQAFCILALHHPASAGAYLFVCVSSRIIKFFCARLAGHTDQVALTSAFKKTGSGTEARLRQRKRQDHGYDRASSLVYIASSVRSTRELHCPPISRY